MKSITESSGQVNQQIKQPNNKPANKPPSRRDKRIYSRNWRSRKAYWTAFVVAMRYLRLFLLEKILGRRFYDKRIMTVHVKNAHYIKKTILELQGLFIKVGQLLSIMTNFLPEAFHEPLEALQDQLPPRPFAEVKKRIETELKQPLENVFEYIAETPIAAASIGQAHKATLKNGDSVIVKVQHANIEKTANIDLDIIRRLTKIVGWIFEIKGIEYVYTQVQKMIEEELDFEKEAISMVEIGDNIKDIEGIIVPKLYPEFSTKRILVSGFCEGVKINNVKQLDEWKLDKRALASRLIAAYCQMVFKDGYYHADPHPGNILVQQDGTIVLLDFGAVAKLDVKMQKGIPLLIEAAVKNDSETIVRILSDLGFIADNKEAEKIAEKLIDTFRYFLQNEIDVQGLNFQNLKVNPLDSELFKVQNEIGIKKLANTIQVPKDYVLLNRMATLLLGICNTLDEKMNPLDTVRPYIQEFILGEKRDWVKFISDLVQRTLSSLLALPEDLRKTLKTIDKGELKVEINDINQGAKLLYHLGHQVMFTLLTISSVVITYLFYDARNSAFAKYGLAVSIFFLILLFRSFQQGKKIKKAF
jgi:predicted unusual protein kinase regulating ubiquinone biosynthesis (AarF/ABC1/UbiB family)